MQEITNTTLEFIILALRVAMVFLRYFFLYQVMRVVGRELRAVSAGSAQAASGGGGGPVASTSYGRLITVSPGQTGLPVGHEFPIGPVTTIGRRPDNDVALNDTFLSSEHALLEWRGDGWWVEDLNSTNGSFVNDIEVTAPTLVSYGDIVRVGRVELKLSR